MKNKLIWLLVFCLGLSGVGWSIPWPFAPSNQTHQLGAGGNYGKYQDYLGSDPYFHPGIDIIKPAGTDVFSVSNGYVYNIGTGSKWWDIFKSYQGIDVSEAKGGNSNGWSYWHMRDFVKSDGITPWQPEDFVSLSDRLGELTDFIGPFGPDHLHFEREHFTTGDNYTTIDNPLRLLSPNPDSTPPTIEEIKYCKNETKNVSTHKIGEKMNF